MAMYFSEEDIDYLKELVTPLMAVQALGIETRKFGRDLSILCPSPDHNDQHFGSCKIMYNGKVCKCFACNRTFTSLQIVMLETGCSLYEGMCTLAEIAGVEEQFEASNNKTSTKELIKNLPNELKNLIGLAAFSKIANIDNCSDYREGDANYMRDKNGDYVRYNNGNWKPWLDLRKENPETFDWLIRNKCKEKMVAIDLLKKKIRDSNGSEISNLCYEFIGRYQYSLTEMLNELDRIYEIISNLYVEHGGRIRDRKIMALNVLKIQTAY